MSFFIKLYKLINILSIDVALGVLSMGFFATKVCDAKMPIAWWIMLPISVWVIYTADHYLDAQKSQKNFLSERHYFHLKHQKTIRFILFISLILGVVIVLAFLPLKILIIGLILSLIVIIYLIINYLYFNLYIPKELIIVIIYITGIWFAPIIYAKQISIITYLYIMAHFTIALSNITIFSVFSYNEDQKSNFSSLCSQWGIKNCSNIIQIIFVINLIIICLLGYYNLKIGAICLAMNSILLIIWTNKIYFSIKNRYRILGDAIFYLGIFA